MIVSSKINDRWDILLTEDRHDFHKVRPTWEQSRLEHCYEHMKQGDTVYDIGAESGDFTSLYHLWVGNEGVVVPVEPSPPYWPSIRRTWEANMLPAPKALFPGFASDLTEYPVENENWDIRQINKIRVMDDGWPNCSHGPIIPDFGFRHLAQQASTTPQIRLDEFVRETLLPPNHIVIDVEGSELRVLQGCRDILAIDKPLVWVSVHPDTMRDWYGHTLLDIDRWMSGYGYTGTMLGSHGGEDFWFYEPI